MTDLVQQAVLLILHGLVTEFPAQLASMAVAALAAGALRAWRRRRAADRTKPSAPAGDQ
ncbi:hypothetical protein ACFWCA_41990 [Streptomyces phaeochromogenes]|uniref:hypothetical protein n=1 Tax=Streptomyces phaeochromogenes TaxID=1923 RepID=UPI0036864729